VLLAELDDGIAEAPRAREPGSDDVRPPKPQPQPQPRDGAWLLWAARKKNRMHDLHRIGRERGFPRRVEDWSYAMVDVAIEALCQTATR